MEATITWDEQRLEKLVEEAKQARRHVKTVAWMVLAVSVVVPRLVGYLTLPRGHAPSAPAWTPPPMAFITPPMVWLSFGLVVAIVLVLVPSVRRLARLYLLFAGIGCLAGLALLGVNAIPPLAWHPVTGATPHELLGYALTVAAGVVGLICARELNRGSTIFACDYVKGEVTEQTVAQALLQAKGPEYERLRDQVGLR